MYNNNNNDKRQNIKMKRKLQQLGRYTNIHVQNVQPHSKILMVHKQFFKKGHISFWPLSPDFVLGNPTYS